MMDPSFSNFNQSMPLWKGLMLCPRDYQEVLDHRVAAFGKLMQKIKGAGLNPEQEKQLHVAIQGYFREWFVQSSQFKSISDILKQKY